MDDRGDREFPARQRQRRRHRPHLAAPVGVLALTLALAACGGGAKAGGVASLGGSDRPTATTAGGDSRKDPRQAALEFSRCMRQHGIDMPDPKFSGDGGVTLEARAGGAPVKGDDPKFKAAEQACQRYMPKGGEATRPNPQQVAQALKFARCMRQHGVDMPDPDTSGGLTVQKGSGMASNGPRPDDPKFKAAQEACKQYVPGGPGGPALSQEGGR